MLEPKFVKFLMSILKRQVHSCSNFASFFIAMTHKSSVNFKLIQFLLWIKGSYQSPNFETLKCLGENLSYSSCHFPNCKLVILQTLHFIRSNVIYFAQRKPVKVDILRVLSAQVKIHQILVIF